MCLRGASEIEKHVLEKIPDDDLRVYLVWEPILRAGSMVEPAARREGGRVPDPRVTRFYDPEARLARVYSEIIQLPLRMPAWDVYFVFSPSARWSAANGNTKPPPPTYWMHQLGRAAPRELYLDGEQMAHVVKGLLWALHTEALRAN